MAGVDQEQDIIQTSQLLKVPPATFAVFKIKLTFSLLGFLGLSSRMMAFVLGLHKTPSCEREHVYFWEREKERQYMDTCMYVHNYNMHDIAYECINSLAPV